MTNRTHLVQRLSLAALVAAASVPAFVACGGASATNPTPTAANGGAASAGTIQQGQYPQQQQGQYPQQQGAYPQQQQGAYPQQQQGAYPQQQQGAYPQQQQPTGAAYPQQPVQQQVPPGATAATAPTTAPTAPLAPVTTTNPNDLASLFAQAAAAGQAMLQQPGQIPGDPTELGLQAAALMHAKGEQLQGQIAKANLQEGGHNEFMVTMQPGTCYTIIGYSPTGQIKNVDLHLLAPPFYNVLAGQDTTDNNQAFIGSTPNPMCPVIPLPLQYKVDIAARTGSGTVGVGIYTKAK